MRTLVLAAAIAALAACSQETSTPAPEAPAAEAPAPVMPAADEVPPPDQFTTQPADPALANYGPDLADCGGAIAALANIDIATFPQRDGAWEDEFGIMLALTDRGTNFANADEARQAFEARKQVWAGRTREQQQARAEACRVRFGSLQNQQ